MGARWDFGERDRAWSVSHRVEFGADHGDSARTRAADADADGAIREGGRAGGRGSAARIRWREFFDRAVYSGRRRISRVGGERDLVALARDSGPAAAYQEIEIRALVGLIDVVDVKLLIAAGGARGGWRPRGAAFAEFFIGNQELDLARIDVELDHISVLNQRQRPAYRRFGRDVQDHRSVCRAAHAAVGDADYVRDAAFQQLFRDRHVADFGHAGIASRTGAFQDHHGVLVDIERRIVRPLPEVFDVFEDDRFAAMLQKPGSRGARFDHCSVGRKIASQDGDAGVFADRGLEFADHFAIPARRIGGVFAHGLAIDRRCVAMDQVAEFAHNGGDAAGVVKIFHQEFA